jgi:hypothetical protein
LKAALDEERRRADEAARADERRKTQEQMQRSSAQDFEVKLAQERQRIEDSVREYEKKKFDEQVKVLEQLHAQELEKQNAGLRAAVDEARQQEAGKALESIAFPQTGVRNGYAGGRGAGTQERTGTA